MTSLEKHAHVHAHTHTGTHRIQQLRRNARGPRSPWGLALLPAEGHGRHVPLDSPRSHSHRGQLQTSATAERWVCCDVLDAINLGISLILCCCFGWRFLFQPNKYPEPQGTDSDGQSLVVGSTDPEVQLRDSYPGPAPSQQVAPEPWALLPLR